MRESHARTGLLMISVERSASEWYDPHFSLIHDIVPLPCALSLLFPHSGLGFAWRGRLSESGVWAGGRSLLSLFQGRTECASRRTNGGSHSGAWERHFVRCDSAPNQTLNCTWGAGCEGQCTTFGRKLRGAHLVPLQSSGCCAPSGLD